MVFNFAMFKLKVSADENEKEILNCQDMYQACINLVQHLGGELSTNKNSQVVDTTATHYVVFRKTLKTRRLDNEILAGKQIVWFGWITECFFRMRRLDPQDKEFCMSINSS